MHTLETQRLTLRGFSMGDLDDMYEYAKNPNVGNFGGWEPHKSREITEGILATFIERDMEWAIVYKENNKVIGGISVHTDPKRRVANANVIGYSLSEDYWGKGIMTEAVKRVIEYAFEEANTQVLSVYHFEINDRSRRVVEKCGFVFEGRMRCSYQMYDGKIYDDFCYSILKEEYFLSKLSKS